MGIYMFITLIYCQCKVRGRPFDSEGGLSHFGNKYSDLENAENK